MSLYQEDDFSGFIYQMPTPPRPPVTLPMSPPEINIGEENVPFIQLDFEYKNRNKRASPEPLFKKMTKKTTPESLLKRTKSSHNIADLICSIDTTIPIEESILPEELRPVEIPSPVVPRITVTTVKLDESKELARQMLLDTATFDDPRWDTIRNTITVLQPNDPYWDDFRTLLDLPPRVPVTIVKTPPRPQMVRDRIRSNVYIIASSPNDPQYDSVAVFLKDLGYNTTNIHYVNLGTGERRVNFLKNYQQLKKSHFAYYVPGYDKTEEGIAEAEIAEKFAIETFGKYQLFGELNCNL